MQFIRKILTVVGSATLLCSACYGATVTGTVKGPDGAPFMGAFVQAQNLKMKATFMVLSNSQGHYEMDKVPAGEYRMTIKAVGFTADPQSGVNLTADQNASFDFALKTGTVRWNDINFYQAMQLWPAGKGKDVLIANCSICHLFQTRMASVRRDGDGWKDRVEYMRTAMHFSLSRLSDADADALATYLTSLFGPDSVLPKSPTDMPGYKATVRPFSSDAMNIVYVEYDMPGPSRMPFSAAPDKDGNIWIPNFGVANKISRLNPVTGEMTDYPVPNVGTAAVHSTVPALDGTVWSAEQGSNKLARWDPVTKQITEFQDTYAGGPENQGIARYGEKHTLRIDTSGNVWATGVPLTKFDPETKKFTHFPEVAGAYDVKPDKNGDVWFTSPNGEPGNTIGKVDGKTMKVTQWTVPTPKAFPRRLEIGADGIIWFTEFNIGKMGRFDSKTQTFEEFPLPGPDVAPYALGTDADGNLWYDSHHQDIIGRFDIKTHKVTEYPFPQSELSMREFFRDAQGRMWFGTNPNNKVGYWYLAKPAMASK
jgi:virginiamycin B lyase